MFRPSLRIGPGLQSGADGCGGIARRSLAYARPSRPTPSLCERKNDVALNRCTSKADMSLGCRHRTRLFGSTLPARSSKAPDWASEEARTALEGFTKRYANCTKAGEPVSEYRQRLDTNQVHLLRLTLANMLPLGTDSREGAAALKERENTLLASDAHGSALHQGIPMGTPLLPGEHLVFFTPRVATCTLGADGSDTSFNPPGGVFTRRMWAGGSMHWDKGQEALSVGDNVWERTYVEDAQLKQLGGGRGEMMVVWVRKEFGTDRAGRCLVDKRSWVFQRALGAKSSSSTTKNHHRTEDTLPSDAPAPSAPSGILRPTHLRQTSADLFRYSALTFNAHAIHLSKSWAQQVEGHPDIVVHGPLNLSLLLRKWGRDVAGWQLDGRAAGAAVLAPKQPARRLTSVAYRAKRPVYAGDDYWVGFSACDSQSDVDVNADTHKLVAILQDGSVAMEATVTSEIV